VTRYGLIFPTSITRSFERPDRRERPMSGAQIIDIPPPHPLSSRRQAGIPMKVRNSLKSLRGRHRDNRIVRRRGRVYVINKTRPRFKARQG